MTARDERLLVGRRDDLARPQGREHRAQAHDAARADDDEIDVVAGHEVLEGRAGRADDRDRRRLSCAACSSSRALFEPVARATTRNASGCAASTSTAWRPIDPVEPMSATRRGSAASGKDRHHVERHHGRGEQERVDPVEHAAVARDQRARVLGAGGALDHGSARSPACAASAASGPRTRACAGACPTPHSRSATATVEATTPPTRPAYVFEGEMWARNFSRPNCRPTR